MNTPSIFISCGQFSKAEKQLGRAIAALVKSTTNLDAFFAEEVQDLNGLDTNILSALRDCVAFITVLHPRGKIARPDGPTVTRASVWIEQEIAVAAYIQRVEKRPLRIIAFKHKSVDREGIRELLHLNPIEFESEDDVLAALPDRLKQWKSLKPQRPIHLRLTSRNDGMQDGHAISRVDVILVNDTARPIKSYSCEICMPASILRHWSETYPSEVPSDPNTRCFRTNEMSNGPIEPRQSKLLAYFAYCMPCASEHEGITAANREVSVKAWIDGEEHEIRKTMQQLATER